MDLTTVVTLLISIVSLAVAAYIGIRQYVIQNNSNNVPINFEILSRLQSTEFHDNFDFATERLGEYDSDSGLMGLPREARIKVLSSCYFFQHIAMLMVLDLIDERIFTAYFRARVVALWAAVEPFIQAERVLNPRTGPEFLTPLEVLAIKAGNITPEVGQEILRKWFKKRTDKRHSYHAIMRLRIRSEQGPMQQGADQETPGRMTQPPGEDITNR